MTLFRSIFGFVGAADADKMQLNMIAMRNGANNLCTGGGEPIFSMGISMAVWLTKYVLVCYQAHSRLTLRISHTMFDYRLQISFTLAAMTISICSPNSAFAQSPQMRPAMTGSVNSGEFVNAGSTLDSTPVNRGPAQVGTSSIGSPAVGETTAGTPASAAPLVPPNSAEVTVPAGTKVRVAQGGEELPMTSSVGKVVDFKVVDDVIVDGWIVIPAGAIAQGHISELKQWKLNPFKFGGQEMPFMAIDLDWVTCADGRRIHVSGKLESHNKHYGMGDAFKGRLPDDMAHEIRPGDTCTVDVSALARVIAHNRVSASRPEFAN